MSINIDLNLGTTFKELAQSITDDVDLKDFTVEVSQGFTYPISYYLLFSKKVDVDQMDKFNGDLKSVFQKAFDPIFDNIKNSPAAQRKWDEIEAEKIQLEKQLDEAKTRITELEKFENYYKLALTMEHGEK